MMNTQMTPAKTAGDTAAAQSRWQGHKPLSHVEIRKIVFGIMLAIYLGALDQTIVATALPTIGRRFGAIENLSWVVTAYLLTSTAVTPLYGKLSDMHGRRAMMLIGIGVFMAGSLACAVAPNMLMLILARAVQGMGAGGLLPLAQTIIGDVVLPKERGRYQAYLGSMWMMASITGPLLGGVLSEYLHCR
jgi:MFS family permease